MENMVSEGPRRRGRRPKDDDSETQVVENSVPRVEMRSDMREESSIERAKRRTAELSGQLWWGASPVEPRQQASGYDAVRLAGKYH